MCGIAGFMGGASAGWNEDAPQLLRVMADALAHRGPDGAGYWYDANHGIALAHRRLAIVDLSVEGAQPMASASGRYIVTFNGEIYNHRDLRGRLPNRWRGTSDTETLLAAFEAWGIATTINAAVGMFAFAVWDRDDKALTLARDRLGEKPLYYGWQSPPGVASPSVFLFASDLAALRKHPAFGARISHDALRMYMRQGNIGGSRSIYEDIAKLPAGSFVTIRPGETGRATPTHYWTSYQTAQEGRAAPFAGGAEQAADALESILRQAINQQMVADVPLGVFLSGGVDSSVVAALMQMQSARPIDTFSIGFEEADYNEAHHAQAVAAHLGTHHTEMVVSAKDALQVIPDLSSIYSEPFADASQIPTFLLSRLTRKHVTVALSGDGGDEVFGGYNRYQFADKYWSRIARVPLPVRRALASLLRSISPGTWDKFAASLKTHLPIAGNWAQVGEKVHKGAQVLASSSADDLYIGLLSNWPDPGQVVVGGRDPGPLRAAMIPEIANLGSVEKMMVLDMIGYMCDDVLTKVDRAAMASSLETRVPLLDHRVVEFAWSLPMHYKIRSGETKWILRQVLYRHVPKGLIERPKSGFAVPLHSWLRGPLRDWAEDLLSEPRLRRDGYLHPEPIRQKWAEHLSGRRNWQTQLWSVLMFQSWLGRSNG